MEMDQWKYTLATQAIEDATPREEAKILCQRMGRRGGGVDMDLDRGDNEFPYDEKE